MERAAATSWGAIGVFMIVVVVEGAMSPGRFKVEEVEEYA